MKLIFGKKPSLHFRLFLILMISITSIIADTYVNSFIKIHKYLYASIMNDLYFFSNWPINYLDKVIKKMKSRHHLELENKILYKKVFLQTSQLLLLEKYKKENNHLRKLLGMVLNQHDHKILAQVIAITSNSVIIDKGTIDGVYQGQPVINDEGVVGCVASVNKTTSRVLLICDLFHILPIQVLRNNRHMILNGNGCTCNKSLNVTYLSDEMNDIHIGDVLVTSGLGNSFPAGYPVAIITSIDIDIQQTHTIVQAYPIAELKSLNYVLLLKGKHNNHPSSSVERK